MSNPTDSIMSLFRIELLRGTNYATWQVNMQDLLNIAGLWSITTDSLLRPDTNMLALSYICLRVAPSHLIYVLNSTTAAAAWLSLKTMFELSSGMAAITTR
ncbi:hypothetical protein NEOLEDRAFT_1070691 [Neolentinus lepideus HHB14362 ss-1]|uniref:DUF4219 domain-containing protein n=1 Tax=Neolentinus lepideus HHB14362 ss-1 TaxID=1314782 RepID=A0A165QSQ1_9AGAM|nr:hypothetical protein NEOLEDRAFT_1070691 [Neolentinus lepideus HHB14362 ss-1]